MRMPCGRCAVRRVPSYLFACQPFKIRPIWNVTRAQGRCVSLSSFCISIQPGQHNYFVSPLLLHHDTPGGCKGRIIHSPRKSEAHDGGHCFPDKHVSSPLSLPLGLFSHHQITPAQSIPTHRNLKKRPSSPPSTPSPAMKHLPSRSSLAGLRVIATPQVRVPSPISSPTQLTCPRSQVSCSTMRLFVSPATRIYARHSR